MPVNTTVACPECDAQLVIEGLGGATRIQCASCSAQFVRGEAPRREADEAMTTAHALSVEHPHASPSSRGRGEIQGEKRTAARAKWTKPALVLGILSIFPLVGLAAVVSGALGLIAVVRHPEKTGRGRAIFGIVAGVLTTLGWGFIGLIGVVGYMTVGSSTFTNNPSELTALAAEIGTYDVPAGMLPNWGRSERMPGVRSVCFLARDHRHAMLVVTQFSKKWEGRTRSMEDWIRLKVKGSAAELASVNVTRKLTYKIRGQNVAVTENFGIGVRDGDLRREYLAFFPTEAGTVGILLLTRDQLPAKLDARPKGAANLPITGLTEDQVRMFFESFR